MTDLHKAAQQALEALEMSRRFVYADNRPQCDEAIDALRAALAQQEEPAWMHPWPPVRAQQAEPVQEPYTGDVTRIMRDAGMTFHLGLPHKAVVEQMTRVVDLVYAEASIKAAQQFAVALAQQAEGGGNLPPPLQAEPVEPVATLIAQRDALLEALRDATKTIEHLGYPLAAIERARAAIKAVEEGK